ncbi:MAG: DUF3997 domain-containing protein [Bacteroidetes bacterium]|nr:DUF3997 domain-containing protein [Bacteroidota bacterium]
MKKIIKLFIFLLIILCLACQYLVYKKKIVDKYYLIATDTKSDMSVSYDLGDGSFIGIVNGGVYAIGNNSNFIIIKQYHLNRKENAINTQIIYYYIIPINPSISKFKVEENIVGPLDEINFNIQREKLDVPQDLIFKTYIKENMPLQLQ